MKAGEPGLLLARLGLIGAGRWGRNYIRTITEIEGAQLTRLATSNQENHALVDSDCRLSVDWRDVLEASDLDGVIVATPPNVHAEIADAAIAAGLPVLVEKPLTLDCAEADSLLEKARAKNALVMVNHTHVYSPAFRELSRRAHDLGPLRRIKTEAGKWGPFRNDVGVLWDWGAHDLAMCLTLAGDVPSEIKVDRLNSQTTEDGLGETYSLQFQFPSTLTADIEISNLRREKRRWFAACFDSKALIYNDVSSIKLSVHEIDGVGEICPKSNESITVESTPPLTCVVIDFINAISQGATDNSGLALGADVVELLTRCETALHTTT